MLSTRQRLVTVFGPKYKSTRTFEALTICYIGILHRPTNYSGYDSLFVEGHCKNTSDSSSTVEANIIGSRLVFQTFNACETPYNTR